MENLDNAKRTVLIVDDDEDLLILIQHALSVEGFDPICSPNGVNIVPIVTRKHPDVILLDIRLNGRDGVEICKQLKLDPQTASTPIIMFSANDNIKAISQECGADGYIKKPFNSDHFREVLRSVLLQREQI